MWFTCFELGRVIGCGQWSSELEDQEKVFMQQATQVNSWDGTLAKNGEKVQQRDL